MWKLGLVASLLLASCASDASYTPSDDLADFGTYHWSQEADLEDLSYLETMSWVSRDVLADTCVIVPPTTLAGKIVCNFQLSGEFGTFQGAAGAQIAYAHFPSSQDTPSAVLVLVSGRTESMLKYAEMIYDFQINNPTLGYSIYIMDNRGQGFSDRLLELDNKEGIDLYNTANYQKGYIDSFDNYVNDLETFVSSIVKPESYPEAFMLGHSMGGAIATRYLETQASASAFNAAVLSSPMHGIAALQGVGGSINWAVLSAWANEAFAPGSGPYEYVPHSELVLGDTMDLTRSSARYEFTEWARRSTPFAQIRLGGATASWVLRSNDAAEQMVAEATKMRTPVLLMQGSEDKLVALPKHTEFCDASPVYCAVLPYANSEHEIMQEVDSIRSLYMTRIVNFFKTYKAHERN